MTVTVTQANGVGQPILGGIALMLLGVFLMTGMDVAAKWLLDTYSLSQLVFLRCAVSMLVIGLFVLIRGDLRALHTRRPGWHLLRAVMMTLATFSFFYALHLMPLANVVIIAFAAPVIVTALSGPLLGERVGIWRWSAVVVGFIGVIVVVRPAPGLIGSGALLAVFATFMWAGLSLTARKLSASKPTAALSLYLFPLPMLMRWHVTVLLLLAVADQCLWQYRQLGDANLAGVVAVCNVRNLRRPGVCRNKRGFSACPGNGYRAIRIHRPDMGNRSGGVVLAGVAGHFDAGRSRRHYHQRPGHSVSRDPNHVPGGGAVGFCAAGCRACGGRPLARFRPVCSSGAATVFRYTVLRLTKS